MTNKEKANHKKLLKDLSSDNLSDQEIVEMWRAPAIQQVNDGLSNFKLENFLVAKGVSREYAPKGVNWLRKEALTENKKSAGKDTLGGLLTGIFESMTSTFKFKR